MMAIIAALSLLFAAFAYQVENARRVRDAARRAQCVNNLKQIGIALATYEEDQGVYPIGTVPNPDLPVDRRLGWMYSLIPYLDLRSSFNADHPTRPWDDPMLGSFRSSPPGVAYCPTIWMSAPPGPPLSAVYVGIAGLGVDAPGLPKGDPSAGFFGDRRTLSPGDITDGFSSTMVVVESSRPAGPWFAGGRHTVRGLDPARRPYIGPARQFGGIHHDEGANVLMADGSVRRVRGSIDPKVFEAMSTVAGREKISAPWEE
jgi:prepilin-type processing-associated H-X9-DG protein